MAAPLKRLPMDNDSSRLLVIVSVDAVITVFCLVSTKALLSQASYHRRVLSADRKALKQLNDNITAANTLVTQYQVFENGSPTNLIGGKNSTDANLQPPDGDNARLVLNALPSKYDFPALITSVTKILNTDHAANPNITGTDLSISSSDNSSASPQAIAIPLTITGDLSYADSQTLIKDIERSIRPYDITNLQMRGSNANMQLTISLNTYYQPPLTINISTKEIK